MDEIVTEIEIDAPPEAVWTALTDFETDPEWNPELDAVRELLQPLYFPLPTATVGRNFVKIVTPRRVVATGTDSGGVGG